MTEQLKRLSVYKFTDKNDITFKPIEYSKFKYGSKTIANKYGSELANTFILSDYFIEIVNKLKNQPDMRVIVMSSPYIHVPTATFALKNKFVNILNSKLIELDLKPIIETKISRRASYKSDYGAMNKEQRFNIMVNDIFHVDHSLLNDNICLFLDDIVITGAHEHRIVKMLEHYNVGNYHNKYFLYFAELMSHEANPNIENYLNYAYIKDLKSISQLIREDEFVFNTRVVKYILDSKYEKFKDFIEYQSFTFNETLYNQAIGNSYHTIPDYKKNFNFLKQYIINYE